MTTTAEREMIAGRWVRGNGNWYPIAAGMKEPAKPFVVEVGERIVIKVHLHGIADRPEAVMIFCDFDEFNRYVQANGVLYSVSNEN